MPVVIPKDLPANDLLEKENIFVMNDQRAIHQDIRPLEILILNLMPTKLETEYQLLRLLSNSPLQVNITLLKTESYQSKNTSYEHMDTFYKAYDDIKEKRFDGLIITGAPVEQMPFEHVVYWSEMKRIMDFANASVTSTLHICWGAQAGLFHHYGIDKTRLDKKLSGVFKHKIIVENSPLLRGFDDVFYMPHSRYTTYVYKKNPDLIELAHSEEAGYGIVASKDYKNIFVSGHLEYTSETLSQEYFRDISKGINAEIPKNYFVADDPNNKIQVLWRSHAHLLFANWLNYCVYQRTPYNL